MYCFNYIVYIVFVVAFIIVFIVVYIKIIETKKSVDAKNDKEDDREVL